MLANTLPYPMGFQWYVVLTHLDLERLISTRGVAMCISWSEHHLAQQNLEERDVHNNLYFQHESALRTELSMFKLVFLCVSVA